MFGGPGAYAAGNPRPEFPNLFPSSKQTRTHPPGNTHGAGARSDLCDGGASGRANGTAVSGLMRSRWFIRPAQSTILYASVLQGAGQPLVKAMALLNEQDGHLHP